MENNSGEQTYNPLFDAVLIEQATHDGVLDEGELNRLAAITIARQQREERAGAPIEELERLDSHLVTLKKELRSYRIARWCTSDQTTQ